MHKNIIEAILFGRSRMEPKVALLKPLSSAISIGTGGPFGVEGPIIMTGGAFGSLFAQFFHLSSAERKTLGDVVRILGDNANKEMTVLEAGSRNLILTYPDELLRDALAKMK